MSFLFKRILFLIFDIFLLVFLALVVLTLLSRFGYLDLVGLSIVASNSMEPSLRVGDLVLYSCGNYSVGDVILYCVTPSHCIVHRIIDLVRVNMSNGDRIMLITKGDNANQTDSPIELSMVRGRVILSIPREIWIPLLVAVIVYSLYGIARIPVIGFSYVISLALAII
ncbi:MAG: signal peptidase I, partial [Sulfolobales archaeon]